MNASRSGLDQGPDDRHLAREPVMAQRPRQLQPYASAEAFFGAQLRSWRTRAGLSQADLARQVHVSGDLIGKIEKAQRRAHPKLAADLDTVLATGGALTRHTNTHSTPRRSGPRTPPPAAGPAGGTPSPTTSRARPVGLRLLDQAVAALYAGPSEPDPDTQPLPRPQAPT